jgi:transcriptional regulator with GAF, ATPase, and Fis domain
MSEIDNNLITSFDEYSPKSKVMREGYEAVADFAKAGFRCIFCGPRGVGKEIIANYYVRKFREERPGSGNILYLSINCASLTDSLAQSELGRDFGISFGSRQ